MRDVDTAAYGLVTITDVFVTADLRLAKVYVSFFGTDKTKEECLEFIEEHAREMRMAIGKAVRLKFTPELRFFIDETQERAQRIEELLKQIHEEEENRGK